MRVSVNPFIREYLYSGESLRDADFAAISASLPSLSRVTSTTCESRDCDAGILRTRRVRRKDEPMGKAVKRRPRPMEKRSEIRICTEDEVSYMYKEKPNFTKGSLLTKRNED
jgi:hypothetical protein